MARLLAAAAVIIICTAVGMALSSALRLRCVQLKCMRSVFEEMATLIRYRAVRCKELMTELCGREAYSGFDFLNRLDTALKSGIGITEAWQTSARQARFITESDREILLSTGEQLGTTDIEGQLSMLTLSAGLAEKNLMEAREESTRKGRMTLCVWVLCGIAAGIMLL
ncbi:MAG: stage III sporulation protein AB [Ruminiclostridium sp.]